MAITNLPTELTSAGNTGTAGDYSSAGTSVFQISYANIGYVPSTTNVYENDFGAELRVFINGVRIYRLSSDTVGTDTSLTTAQKNRLDALNTSYGNQPWTIDSTNSRIQINKDHTVWGDTHTDNCGYPALSAWTIIKVVRIKSDKTTLTTDFQNASVLTEKQLDNAFLETFHIAQEAFDKTASGSLNKDTDDVWDANTTRIKNVSDPVNDQDVATKAWVNSNANTTTVAGSIANVNHVAGQISPTNNISTVATSVTAGHIATVAGDAADIGAVATREAEIGRLGTAEAVADMAILGTTDVVADMAILATTDVVADMNTLGTADVVADMNTLATADVVADMNTLGTADVVSDMNTLATTDNVSNMDTVATNITNVNNVGSNISSVNSVATNISQVTTFSDTYHTAGTTEPSGSNVTEGDLWFDTANDVLKVYDGSSWGSASSSIATVASQNEFTASDGQGTDNKYFALVHDVGLELVFLNGVRLKRGNDYYCTNSNTSTTAIASGNAATFVRLETVPSTNDILSVMAFGQIANNLAVNTAGGTFTGAVTFEGQNTHNTGSNTFTMPTTRGTTGYVLTRDDTAGTGGTTWKETVQAPAITNVSGEINEDTNTTLTVTGTGFASGMTIKLVNASSGADITGHTTLSYTGSSSPLTVTIPSATTNITAGTSVKLHINKTGLTTESNTIVVSEDPNWVTNAGNIATILSATGTGVNVGSALSATAGAGGGTINYVIDSSDTSATTYFDLGLTSGQITTDASNALSGLIGSANSATETFIAYAQIAGEETTKKTPRTFNIIVNKAPTHSGGSVDTSITGYKIHWWKYADTGGSFTTYGSLSAQILVVAGGGGGGGQSGAGGGAGGLRLGTISIPAGTYTITVGNGGTAGPSPASGSAGGTGGDSSIGTIIVSKGGGGGGGYDVAGVTGGSGGGGAGGLSANNGASALALNPSQVTGETYNYQGFAGGDAKFASGSSYSHAGGGGASAVGVTPAGPTSAGGNGGAGRASDIITTSLASTNSIGQVSGGYVYFSGGGGGSSFNGSSSIVGGSGGLGGGADGVSANNTAGSAGTAHTGGGGGGGVNAVGGAGGSGIVIIRYAI